MKEITELIRPPRTLFVPFDLGYPLGEPNNPELQHKIIQTALELFQRDDTPVLEEFQISNKKS